MGKGTETNCLLLRSLCSFGAQICPGQFYHRACAVYCLDNLIYRKPTKHRACQKQCRGMVEASFCNVFTEKQRLWEKKDVKSARTLATVVFLIPPEHMPVLFVVMDSTSICKSHFNCTNWIDRTSLTELRYINGCWRVLVMEVASATPHIILFLITALPTGTKKKRKKGKRKLKGSVPRLLHEMVWSAIKMFTFYATPLTKTCITHRWLHHSWAKHSSQMHGHKTFIVPWKVWCAIKFL